MVTLSNKAYFNKGSSVIDWQSLSVLQRKSKYRKLMNGLIHKGWLILRCTSLVFMQSRFLTRQHKVAPNIHLLIYK